MARQLHAETRPIGMALNSNLFVNFCSHSSINSCCVFLLLLLLLFTLCSIFGTDRISDELDIFETARNAHFSKIIARDADYNTLDCRSGERRKRAISPLR